MVSDGTEADADLLIIRFPSFIERSTMKAIMTMMGVGALVVAMAKLATAQVTVVYQQDFSTLQAGQLVLAHSFCRMFSANFHDDAAQFVLAWFHHKDRQCLIPCGFVMLNLSVKHSD